MSRFPRRLNLQGGVPIWRPATALQIEALAEQARAAGLDVTITPDCKLLAHNVCQQYTDRHLPVTRIYEAGNIASLVEKRAQCPEHGAVAV